MKSEAVFQAVSDPTRRAILAMLAEGERSAGELQAPFPISQPAVSRHLRVLRQAGLVHERPDGRRRMYSLDARPLRDVYDWASHYERFWLDRLERFGAVLDRKAAE
jgi:DNA-binding transcriptional ArsR family regulator